MSELLKQQRLVHLDFLPSHVRCHSGSHVVFVRNEFYATMLLQGPLFDSCVQSQPQGPSFSPMCSMTGRKQQRSALSI